MVKRIPMRRRKHDAAPFRALRQRPVSSGASQRRPYPGKYLAGAEDLHALEPASPLLIAPPFRTGVLLVNAEAFSRSPAFGLLQVQAGTRCNLAVRPAPSTQSGRLSALADLRQWDLPSVGLDVHVSPPFVSSNQPKGSLLELFPSLEDSRISKPLFRKKTARYAARLDRSGTFRRRGGLSKRSQEADLEPSEGKGEAGRGSAPKPATGGKTNRIKAMQHPLRARILRTLVENEVMSPAELARVLGAQLSDVSYHVRRLEELDCAELVRTRPVRGAVEHFYRPTERHLIDTDEWEQLDPITAEDLVCGYVQRILDDFVDSRKAEIVGYDSDFHITRTPQLLDPKGFEEGMESAERHRLEMSEIEKRSAERRAKEGTPTVPVSSSVLLFKVPRRSLNNG